MQDAVRYDPGQPGEHTTRIGDRNEALLAAGFAARYPEPPLPEIAPAVDDAITRMMDQQEPYPLTVLSILTYP